ncbi:MAG: RNA polymerase sigma factor [Bacillota bacterium]
MLDEDGQALYALLSRLTLRQDVAEDLMQDLFANLCRSQGFQRCPNPAAYARQAAIHLAFNWRRSQRRSRQMPMPESDPPAEQPLPLARLIQAEQAGQVLDALEELSEQSRDIVVMRFIEGQSYDQIAHHLGRSVHQTRALCHKGIQRLRQMLGKEGGATCCTLSGRS